MKRIFCCLVLMTLIISVNAQKVYFVYLQSETEQSFFVKMNDKVFSSASSGYLILPKLRDSSYTIRIGFPQNKWPEQQFIINVHATDHGYILKNFGDKGWGLFDLQTLAVQMASSGNTGAFRTEPKQVSEFTEVLSRAANDPSLKLKTIAVKMPEKEVEAQSAVVKETVAEKSQPSLDTTVAITKAVVKKSETVSPALKDSSAAITTSKKKDSSEAVAKQPVVDKKDTMAVTRQEVIKRPDSLAVGEVSIKEAVEKKEEVIPEQKSREVKEEVKSPAIPEYSQSKVTRKSESSTTEGLGMVFTDSYANGVKDTVRIVIPNPRVIAKIEEPVAPGSVSDKKMLDVAAEKNKGENKEVKKETTQGSNNSSDKSSRTVPPPILSSGNCKALASEKDYLKLRKKMVSAKNEQDMLEEGKKSFEERCFSTEQIKGLGSLFLQEAVRFQLYEAAYAHNTDKDNFGSLEAELKDPYFIHRFKNLMK